MTEHILGGRDIYEWRQEAEAQAHEVERLHDDLDLSLDLLSELVSAYPRSDPRGSVMGHVKEAEELLRRLHTDSIVFYHCPDCDESFVRLMDLNQHVGTPNCISHKDQRVPDWSDQ